MNGKFKTITGAVIAIFALFGGVWALNKQYVPREVHELEYAQMSQQMIQIQKNNQITYWLNQRFYWQQRVEQLQYECGRQPANNILRQQLIEAKRQRDEADRQIRQLQAQ